MIFGSALRYSVFQVMVMSTTGFATANFNKWPEFSKIVLMLLMFMGGSAGSTAGGLKVSRALILVKETKRLLFRMSHPRSVEIVKLDGKAVDKTVVHAVNSYFITFCVLFAASILLVSLDNFDLDTTLTSVIACISNVDPVLDRRPR